MIQRRLSGNIAIRASEPILLVVMIMVLLQSVSAGQNNAVQETNTRSGANPATLAAMAKPLKTCHGIRDVCAVGKRDIGCSRGLGSRYSLEAQIEMGRSYAQEVETTFKLIIDPVITEYVNRIGQNLVRNSDAQVRFTIKIIETDDVNAFSLPGGFLFVDSGLILAVDNEAELAGVMSHEIAHVAACHAAQEMAREELGTNLVAMPVIFRLLLRQLTLNTVEPTRSFESEADFLAIEYLYKAGYDPQALSSFFEKLKAMEKQKPGSLTKALESHPHMADRIKRNQQEINKLLPPAAEYKVDTSDFQEIKTRLFELENGHELDKNYGGDGPTLRGASPGTPADAGTSGAAVDQHRR